MRARSTRFPQGACRSRVQACLCLLLGSLLLPSCAKKEEAFVIEAINGVKVVHNLAVKTKKMIRTPRIVEDLVLGGDDPEAAGFFFSPVDIDADAWGSIFVLDSRDAVIRHFDRDGTFLGDIGRKGQGPGEYEGPSCLEVLTDGRILVLDMSQMKLTTLTPEGRFESSIVLGSYISDLDAGADGVVIAAYHDPLTSRDCAGILDLKTGALKPVYWQDVYWPARIMNNELTYDFPYFVCSALDSKDRIYAGSGVAYEISVMDPAGHLEFKFRKDANRVPVEGQMLGRISAMTLKGPNPYTRDPYFPFFESLAVDERGRVWVKHYLPKFTAKTNSETPYDIFSPDGVFLFEARVPGHVGKLVFKNGFVYALKKREAGDLVPVRLRLEE